MFLNFLHFPSDLEKAFLKWNAAIYGFIFLRIGSKEAAEDLTQEVFFKAWRSRETFNPKISSLKTWLFIIAINEIKDYMKYSKKETVDLAKIENIISDESSDLQNQINDKDFINLVFKKLSLLSDRDRELIILRFKSDLSVKEISKIFAMEYTATKVALHRAIKRLSELCNEN